MRQSLLVEDILATLRQRVTTMGTQTALAARLGISKQYLSDILTKRREPGPAVLAALGLVRCVTSYAPAPRAPAPRSPRSVPAAARPTRRRE